MNIKEVAKLAKVSTATVSRTINGSDKVSARTAERVQKAIKELNFYPNTHARTLVSGRSRMLGLIISDITNPFFPELVKHFEDQAVQKGLEVIIANTDYKPKRMTECIRRMVERKVDGVAIMTSEADPALLVELTRRDIPTEFIEKGDHRIEGGIFAMRNLLRLSERPTAVITSNDLTAIGALGTIHDAGLEVPRDLSLIGFDDISFANLTQPPLTTVLLSRSQLAITALAALEKLIRKEDGSDSNYTISTHLVMRSSTRTL